jgi:hypothetical protein
MGLMTRRRRVRTAAAFGAGVLSLAAVPLVGVMAVDALRESKEGRNALADLPELVRIPPTPGALYATVGDDGVLTTATVLAMSPPVDGVARGGTAITVPINAQVTLSSGEQARLLDAYIVGGDEELRMATEGLLGITLTHVNVADRAEIQSDFVSVSPLPYTADADVLDTVDGVDQPAIVAGDTTLDPAGISTLLLAGATTDTDEIRLARAASFWRAVSSRVATGIGTGATAGVSLDPEASFADFLAAFFGGPVGSYRLATTDVELGEDVPSRVAVNLAEVNLVMATVLPGAISPSFASITFFVRSPLGEPGLTLEAVAMLAYAGANVVLVREEPDADIPPTNTLAVANQANADDGARFASPLGESVSVEADSRIDGVDVVLTLGESFRTLIRETSVSTTILETTSSLDEELEDNG